MLQSLAPEFPSNRQGEQEPTSVRETVIQVTYHIRLSPEEQRVLGAAAAFFYGDMDDAMTRCAVAHLLREHGTQGAKRIFEFAKKHGVIPNTMRNPIDVICYNKG